MNNFYCADYGWHGHHAGCTYCAMDRLGIAQYLSRIGLLLDGNTGAGGAAGWRARHGSRCAASSNTASSSRTGSRPSSRRTRRSTACSIRSSPAHADAAIVRACGTGLAVVTEFMNDWRDEHVRWVDAVVQTAAAESEANRALLSRWAAEARAQAAEARCGRWRPSCWGEGEQAIALCLEQLTPGWLLGVAAWRRMP